MKQQSEEKKNHKSTKKVFSKRDDLVLKTELTNKSQSEGGLETWESNWMFGKTEYPDEAFVSQLEEKLRTTSLPRLWYQRALHFWSNISLVGFPIVAALLLFILLQPMSPRSSSNQYAFVSEAVEVDTILSSQDDDLQELDEFLRELDQTI